MNLLDICIKHENIKPPARVDVPPPPKNETVIDFNHAPPQLMDRQDRLQARLSELIRMAENSQGMNDEQVRAISDEGDRIIEKLPPEIVKRIFES